jgi:hypothetical protein
MSRQALKPQEKIDLCYRIATLPFVQKASKLTRAAC